MVLTLKTAPAIEPVTLAEAKLQCKIDSTSFADDITAVQSIVPGAHVIAASYSLVGTGVDILGYSALVLLDSGTNGSGGTVDVKIQESDDNVTYTDWATGAFTQVTTANDNAIQEKAYTGTKRYIRVVATVGTATCDFGVSILKDYATSADDTLLTNLIKVAREYAETVTNRALITQTWNYYLNEFPSDVDYIEIPRPPLQSITTLIYTDSDGTANTWSTDYYNVDTDSEPGRIVLEYGELFPTDVLTNMNPINIEFVAGYGTATTDVPEPIRQAMLIDIADMYVHRESIITGTIVSHLDILDRLYYPYRIWRF